MLTYFILTALANVILSYYLLNCIDSKSSIDYVNNFGALAFYIVSALLGCVMIPIIIMSIILTLLIRK